MGKAISRSQNVNLPHLNPCIFCKKKPVFYMTGYGKDHYGVQCESKCQDIDSDNTMHIAAKEWNEVNPIEGNQ